MTLMFDFAPLGLSATARVLAGGLSGSAQVATAAIAIAAAALAFGQAEELLLREHSEGLHVREGWHTLAFSTLTGCAIACCEGAAWHRRARIALAVHLQPHSRAVTVYASGRARLTTCLRLCACRCS